MTERISPQQFQEADGVQDWRVLGDGTNAYFRTGSFEAGIALVDAIGMLSDTANHHSDVDLSYESVIVRLFTTRHVYDGPSERDLELAQQISTVARKLGVPPTHPPCKPSRSRSTR